MSSANMLSRRRSRMVIGALSAALAAASSGATTAARVDEPQTQQVAPLTAASPTQSNPPNLVIQIEGNRRWCVRTIEAIWPAEPPVPAARPPARQRGPTFTTIAYAYYFVVSPARETPATEGEPTAAGAPGAEDMSGEQPEPTAVGEQAAGEKPETAAPAAEAAATPPAAETAAEQESPAAPQIDGSEMILSPVDADLAKRPDSILLDLSPIIRTVSQRRVQRRGKPIELKPFWDLSRSCTSVPSQVNATLPPGRYEVQINFDVLMAQHGWKHVQLARIDGVEVKEGSPTVIALRVNTEGYVEARPRSREVRFLTPESGADPAEAGTQAPAATTPAP